MDHALALSGTGTRDMTIMGTATVMGRGLAALAAWTFMAAAPAAAETRIKAGIAAFNEALTPVYAAQELGYLKEAGIEVEFVDFKGGGPAVQALVGGSIDMCLCAADHVMRLNARRLPTRILVGLDSFHSYALMARADAPYADLASLRGKRIGITAPGSLTDNTLRYAIQKAGLLPDRDFDIAGVGGGAPMQAAIGSGQVAAGLVITTDALHLQQIGGYKIVVDYRNLPYPSFDALVLDSWVQVHREAASGFARAVVRAMDELIRDPAFATQVVARMYPSFPPALTEAVARSAVERMPRGGLVSPESIATLNDIMLATDDSLKRLSPKDAFDPSLLRK